MIGINSTITNAAYSTGVIPLVFVEQFSATWFRFVLISPILKKTANVICIAYYMLNNMFEM